MRDIRKGAIAIVTIEILPAEIVSNVEVGPSIVVVIAPSAGKREAIVVLVHAGRFGNVFKSSVSAIAEQKIRRPVLRIVIGLWMRILTQPLVVSVETKVNIQQSVAVIIGRSDTRERSGRRIRELKCIRF